MFVGAIAWWHWVVLGLFLVSVDVLLVNVFSIFWFGVGALLVGLLLLVFPAMALWLQMLCFSVLSVGFLLVWLFVFRPQRLRHLLREAQELMPGQPAVVVRFDSGRGTLRLQKPVGGRDVWDFAASVPVAAGAGVTVARVGDDGVVVLRDEGAVVAQSEPTQSAAPAPTESQSATATQLQAQSPATAPTQTSATAPTESKSVTQSQSATTPTATQSQSQSATTPTQTSPTQSPTAPTQSAATQLQSPAQD